MQPKIRLIPKRVRRKCELCREAEATLSIHVICRSIGKGQDEFNRVIKTSKKLDLCEPCARSRQVITGALGPSASASINYVQSERSVYGEKLRAAR
jgi:cytidine deaminase